MPAWLGKRRPGATWEDPSDPRKVVLHVGCGSPDPEKLHERFRGPDWRELRLDIDPRVAPDVLGNIVEMPAIREGSVDAVWSSHNLEHVYGHEVPRVLREFLRVLRPGGEALITVPDLQDAAKLIAAGKLEDPAYGTPSGPIAPLDIVYGYQQEVAEGNEYMAHRTGFTARSLARKLREAGFEHVEVSRKDVAIWASARKPS